MIISIVLIPYCFILCFVDVRGLSDYSTAELIGHLQPLGQQHLPSVTIDEFTPQTAPSPKEFYNKYIKRSKAAIFRNAMTETKAYKLWTDDYIKTHYGDLEVRLEGKKENVHSTPVGEKYFGRDTIRHFVDHYHDPNSNTYIVSELPKQMYGDVGVLPSLGACGAMTKSFVEIDIWWSGGDSKSLIHKDAFNQINCLHRGTKFWKLYEFKYEKWLYKHYENDFEIGGFSEINVEAVDLIQHPDYLKVPWSNFTIHAGDCLFLPKSYYHQVDSDGPFNLAVSILFSRFDFLKPTNYSDCTADTDYVIPRPLSDIDVMWQWEGKGVMSMGRGDLEESFRFLLKRAVNLIAKKGLMLDEDILKKMFHGLSGDGRKTANYSLAVEALDSNGDKNLSVEEITNATYQQLRTFGIAVEPYEPSNTYEFEYSYISHAQLFKYLKDEVLNTTDTLSRQQWVKLYQERFFGTKTSADEIFTGLAQSDTSEVITCKDITEQDIERALSNWKKFYAPQYDEEWDKSQSNSIDDADELDGWMEQLAINPAELAHSLGGDDVLDFDDDNDIEVETNVEEEVEPILSMNKNEL